MVASVNRTPHTIVKMTPKVPTQQKCGIITKGLLRHYN